MTTPIGLFGGSFDPIHNGHLHIARAFADQTGLDSVIFLPAGDPYHKHGHRTPAHHRLAMTELAVAADSRFAASNADMVRQGPTYSIDTVHIFRQHFPQAPLWWLMGMDSLMQLHTWKNWTALVRQTHIAVAARPGDNLAAAPAPLHDWIGRALGEGSLKLLDIAPSAISSTQIRTTLQQGGDIRGLLPDSVADYIRRHGLYRPA